MNARNYSSPSSSFILHPFNYVGTFPLRGPYRRAVLNRDHKIRKGPMANGKNGRRRRWPWVLLVLIAMILGAGIYGVKAWRPNHSIDSSKLVAAQIGDIAR